MQHIRTYGSFLLAAVVFTAALLSVFPFYQYYIDPDATAYLTIARRYAEGDYARAVNGYWSPWSTWLTALLIKAGIPAFKAAITVNAVAALGFWWLSNRLFLQFRLPGPFRDAWNIAFTVLLLYAVFWQSFGDLWMCFFLLAVLVVLLSKGFLERPVLWIFTGFLGGMAYLSKAYALPVFMLEMVVCGFLLADAHLKQNRMIWLKMVSVCIVTALVCSLPWFYLLYQKYGVWMTGTAGTLNTSWYLVGHPYWKEGILHLLPPVYPDSPSYWEDPWMVNGVTPHFWDSPRLLVLQMVRIGYNILKLVQSMNELSCFFAMASVAAVSVLFVSRLRVLARKQFLVLCSSFWLFPLGYLLINFQGRYLWYMVPLSMVILSVLLLQWRVFHQLNRRFQWLLLLLLSFSFLVVPVLGLKQMLYEGRSEYLMAERIKAYGIRGSFTTNIPYGPQTQQIVRLAYFSGNAYYNMPVITTKHALLAEIKKYRVQYYFHFYDGEWNDFLLTDEHNRLFPEVAQGKIPGVRVFKVN